MPPVRERRRDAAGLGAVLVLLAGTAGPALAWGYEGHRIVAEIAEQYLEPLTVRQVRELLALENATTLAEVSTWADEIRPRRPETAPWHFVDIPVHPAPGTSAAYDAARDCPRGDCVVAAIERFAAVLRDKDAAPRRRLEALKWVVHFVADIHQPLHCADDNDRGGMSTSWAGAPTCTPSGTVVCWKQPVSQTTAPMRLSWRRRSRPRDSHSGAGALLPIGRPRATASPG